MNHDEAVQEMATERYLLDELSPEVKEAFEEHMFECQECAFDVRAGNVFLTEAKVQLPEIVSSRQAAEATRQVKPVDKKPWWSFWTVPMLRPAFAVPMFAVLLGVIGFQNLSMIPMLRSEARAPRLAPWTAFHAGTRTADVVLVRADRKDGAEFLIGLPQERAYASYAIELYDPQGRRFWSRTVSAPSDSGTETLSLLIPGAGLKEGLYSLSLAGISPQGARTEVGRRVLDVHFDE